MSTDPRPRRRSDLLSAVLVAAAGLVAVEAAQSVDRPARAVTDPDVATTRQATTPAGVQSVFDGRVYGVAFGSSASEPTGRVEGRVKTGGVAPFGAAITRGGSTAWVSHWGGRWPRDGDLRLPTGLEPMADRVVVDARGIASTGTGRASISRRVP